MLNNKITHKFFAHTTLLLAASVILAGCSSSETPKKFTTLDEAKSSIVNTVCSVKGKETITDEDISNFRNLATQLETYEGDMEEQILEVSDNLNEIADTWELTVNANLGEKQAESLTRLCDFVNDAYPQN